MTRSIAATETMDWHSNFRCTSSDPDQDIVIFDVEAQSVVLQWSLVGRVAYNYVCPAFGRQGEVAMSQMEKNYW